MSTSLIKCKQEISVPSSVVSQRKEDFPEETVSSLLDRLFPKTSTSEILRQLKTDFQSGGHRENYFSDTGQNGKEMHGNFEAATVPGFFLGMGALDFAGGCPGEALGRTVSMVPPATNPKALTRDLCGAAWKRKRSQALCGIEQTSVSLYDQFLTEPSPLAKEYSQTNQAPGDETYSRLPVTIAIGSDMKDLQHRVVVVVEEEELAYEFQRRRIHLQEANLINELRTAGQDS
ncbi:hypothetical protein DUI87_21288 [Hirundo rustica rustica]|uniref:Uncharacterized protein n=1 Tax=Hirundo rustica rustica TaxID=333673 RepID=A0A3M0JN32_HIRRU|nr:hypothetical protein DUI87_21288 [Hirundo rustica rustica]